jgi:hypothetical protein
MASKENHPMSIDARIEAQEEAAPRLPAMTLRELKDGLRLSVADTLGVLAKIEALNWISIPTPPASSPATQSLSEFPSTRRSSTRSRRARLHPESRSSRAMTWRFPISLASLYKPGLSRRCESPDVRISIESLASVQDRRLLKAAPKSVQHVLEVLPLPLGHVIDSLKAGPRIGDNLRHTPSLLRFVRSL